MAREKCTTCGKKAVISMSYGPHAFCKEHFLRFFEKRVRRTVRENGLVQGGEKLVVACSGGKDSSVALFLIHKIFGKSNEVEALLIDEGIPGYRDKALGFAERNCKKWGIPFRRVSFGEEFGFTMVDVMRKTGAKKKIGGTCAFCGVLRRRLMEKHAHGLGAGKLVTGHNLDDEAQSILMNVCEADVARLARLGPVSSGAAGKFVPRIKPLWECPEIEVIAFAKHAGIRHYSKRCCPFKWQARRNTFRGILNHLEAQHPGAGFSMLSFLKQVKPLVAKSKGKKLGACGKCGEPCSGKVCAVCRQVELMKE